MFSLLWFCFSSTRNCSINSIPSILLCIIRFDMLITYWFTFFSCIVIVVAAGCSIRLFLYFFSFHFFMKCKIRKESLNVLINKYNNNEQQKKNNPFFTSAFRVLFIRSSFYNNFLFHFYIVIKCLLKFFIVYRTFRLLFI